MRQVSETPKMQNKPSLIGKRFLERACTFKFPNRRGKQKRPRFDKPSALESMEMNGMVLSANTTNASLYCQLQLHVGDQNPGANEYDFKRALDILHLVASVIMSLLFYQFP